MRQTTLLFLFTEITTNAGFSFFSLLSQFARPQSLIGCGSRCDKLDQAETRSLLICFLHIMKTISEGQDPQHSSHNNSVQQWQPQILCDSAPSCVLLRVCMCFRCAGVVLVSSRSPGDLRLLQHSWVSVCLMCLMLIQLILCPLGLNHSYFLWTPVWLIWAPQSTQPVKT